MFRGNSQDYVDMYLAAAKGMLVTAPLSPTLPNLCLRPHHSASIPAWQMAWLHAIFLKEESKT
jgi:hypothetical protein